jgi:hypothetical protein
MDGQEWPTGSASNANYVNALDPSQKNDLGLSADFLGLLSSG